MLYQGTERKVVGGWLMGLELEDGEAAYLWPRTPVGNLQAEIWRRCGASDLNMDDPCCRPRMIVDELKGMQTNGLLPQPFSVLDLCCGDGLVLVQIGRAFLDANCFGVDVLHYPTHYTAQVRGQVTVYRVALQQVIASQPPCILDVAIMLNTFRGWDKADLPVEESNLPQRTMAWLRQNCRFVFLTVNDSQVDWLKREGWFLWYVGPGEDDSQMICAFPCDGPEGPRGLWTLGKQKL